MYNIMVDLETYSTKPNAAIRSIGAVVFDNYGTNEEYFRPIKDLNNQKLFEFDIEARTVKWWKEQSEEAKAQFISKPQLHIVDAMEEFRNWIRSIGGQRSVRLWGNGAAFDNVILGHAFKVTGVKQPWEFWNDMCYRTMKNMYKDIKMERVGTYHNALDDAKSQAEHLIQIATRYGLQL